MEKKYNMNYQMMQPVYMCPIIQQYMMQQPMKSRYDMMQPIPDDQYDIMYQNNMPEENDMIPKYDTENQAEIMQPITEDMEDMQPPPFKDGQTMGKALTFNKYYTDEDMNEDMFSMDNDDFFRGKKDKNDTCRILEKIEKSNPEIFKCMMLYGVPYPEAKEMVRRIIKLTLRCHK